MEREIFKGEFKGIKFRYSHHPDNEGSGILIINLPNGVESTHLIKDWGIIRIMQYVESMQHLV